jgi:drug/metabolite transporter (DMT)-like permease
MVGIAAALVAVVLVSRGSEAADRPSGLRYAIVGGIGLGVFNIAVAAFPEHRVAWPLVTIKLASLIAIAIVAIGTRREWRIPVGLVPAAVAVALLDLAGNGFYVLATQAGRIDIAATLSSLYPVTTVVLAVALLRERVSRSHLVGVALAAVAIILIAGGSAGVASSVSG